MDGGAWWAAHRVAKSPTRLSDFTFTFFQAWFFSGLSFGFFSGLSFGTKLLERHPSQICLLPLSLQNSE